MSSFYGASDIQPMLDVFGVPVKLGTTIANCLFDQDDLVMLRGEAASFAAKQVHLTAQTGAFPGIAAGSTVQVMLNDAWVSFQVVSVYQIEDGALSHIMIAPI